MIFQTKKGKFSFRIVFTIIWDIILTTLCFVLSYTYITSHITGEPFGTLEIVKILSVYVASLVVVSALFGAYRKNVIRTLYKSLPIEFLSVLVSSVFSAIVLDVMGLSIVKLISFSGVFLVIIFLAERILYKYVFEFFYKKLVSNENELTPTLIIGAGFMGKSVYREMVESEPREFSPVCFVDDNLGLVGEEVCGIPVFGPTAFIPELCKKYNIGMIVFAIPSCEPNARKRILESCKGLNCQVRVIPSLEELTRVETGYLKQLVNVDVENLLGRDAIRIKNDKVEKFIKNKVCLVTGGGGSIGSELCRQIIKMNPKKLVILDIYENNAYEIQQELKRDGFDDSVVFVEIASVRDRKKMDYLFSKYKFDIVFHASAHKHVPLMETNPEEAIKNNVMGTYNIAHMCHKYSAHKMVLISTDKAVNPTNVMGASKRLCEMVMQYMSQRYKKTKYTAVRFGNVLGSNGSVIPLFTKQIEAGGPVTVTHPDIIRYFMTIPEAVSLVLEAGTMSNGGEIFVLDMGKPVKIVTLAENLIKMYGYKPYEDIDIEFCGLRAGEKLFEELLMSDENLKETYNKRIYINDQIEVDCNMFWEQLKQLFDVAAQNNSEKTVELMHEFVPTFKRPEEINFKKELITK